MKADIAVATVSAKAYYLLVNELKQRNLLFLSLIPGESIPPYIKVVITTEKEKPLVVHPKILVYDAESDPSDIVNNALRIIQNREIYEEVVVGVDPGKTFGVAILGDGKVLKTVEGLSLEKAVDTITMELKKNPAKVQRVKIGIGIPELAEEISRRLRIALPEKVVIELVSEIGTSTLRSRGIRKKLNDADSAIKIATKKGTLEGK